MNSLQERITDLIKMQHPNDLLGISNHFSKIGMFGFEPIFFTSSCIKGTSRYTLSFPGNDSPYHHFPSFGFTVEIYRQIESFPRKMGKYILITESKGTMGSVDNPSIELSCLDRDFFEVLNAARNGDPLFPFTVISDKENLAKNLKTHCFISIEAYCGEHQTQGETNSLNINIEEIILDFLEIFSHSIQVLEHLKPLYRDKDEKGNRLFIDQGQSPEYYELKRKLEQKILGKAQKAMKRQGISGLKSWGIGYETGAFLYAVREYGLRSAILGLAINGKNKIKRILK